MINFFFQNIIIDMMKKGIKMEPRLLNWNISGGIQKVYLTNHGDERRAIKVIDNIDSDLKMIIRKDEFFSLFLSLLSSKCYHK